MKWYNDITKLFMSRGYLDKNQTIEDKISIVSKHSSNILGKGKDFENKLKEYIKKGWYIIPTPVWKNFHPNTLETPISCVVGDTWINTSTGGKMAKDIQIGDLVLTHKNRFKKVTNVIPSKDKGDIYKLKVGTRMTNLFITGNHVVLTNLGWVRVDELDVNKHLIAVNGDLEYDSIEHTIDLKPYTDYKFIVEDGLIKKATENLKDTGKTSVDYYAKVNENIEVDEDLAWALGLWFAEGSLSINNKKEPNGIRVTLNNKDELDIAKKWLDIIKSKFNVNGNIYRSEVERRGKLNSWINVNINSKIIGNLFKSFGEGCKNKKTPDWILNLPKEKLSLFLDGLLTGDGTFRKNECKVTLANPELILQVYNIGLKLGMSMSLQMQDKPSKLSTTKHVYTITFREYINSVNRHSCNSGIKFNDGLVYCPIKTLEKTDRVEDVYDFTVEEDHSFSCAGVVVHNCFGVYVEDSVESIVLKSAEVALQNKIGGGSSGTFQEVRGRGEKIGNEGVSNGSVSMMEIYQTMSSVISQPNRRGHFSATQDIEHKDAHEFLDSRSEGHVIQDLSVGVKISDEFINGLLEEKKENVELFRKLVKQKYDTGFPYIFFTDNVNNNTVDVYKDKEYKIHHSNMCVHGDTQILTSDGYQRIEDLEDNFVQVWNGEEFSEVEVVKTGVNQELFRVETDSGYSLDCTSYHKWYILESTESGKRTKPPRYREVRTHELKQGDKLIKFDLPILEGSKELKYAYTQGFFSGDGYCNSNNVKQSLIMLYGDKRELLPFIDTRFFYNKSGVIKTISDKKAVYNDEKQGRINCYVPLDIINDKTFVPNSDYTVNSRLEWLSGLLDSDGTVAKFNASYTLQISSINKYFLKNTQLMLQTLGCDSKVTISNNTEGIRLLPKNDGSGELGYYNCKQNYRLLINGNSLWKLICLGLKTRRLNIEGAIKPNRECSQFVKVESVEQLPDFHDTFCFTEPKRNMGMFNGILTGNCQEIMLPNNPKETFICNLLGMNVELYDEWKDTDAVEVGVFFMDSMLTDFIDKTKSKKKDNEDYYNVLYKPSVTFAERHRAMGMGMSGLHSFLQSKMIPFNSLQGKTYSKVIAKQIHDQAYEASEKMAKEYGKPDMLKEDKYKRRHTTLLAIAPNSSSSFVIGQQSQSIEPYVSNYYIRDVAKVRTSIKNPYLEKLLKELGKNNSDVWLSILKNDGSVQHLDFLTEEQKDVFKTFIEIPQIDIISMASDRQKYIDQGQSLNLMVGSDTTPDEVAYWILYAWKKGIKTLYYQLNVSAAQDFTNQKSKTECSSCSG